MVDLCAASSLWRPRERKSGSRHVLDRFKEAGPEGAGGHSSRQSAADWVRAMATAVPIHPLQQANPHAQPRSA